MLSGLIALCSRAAAAPPIDGEVDAAPTCGDEHAGDAAPTRDRGDVGATVGELWLVERASGLLDAAAERDLATSQRPAWGRIDIAVVWRRSEPTDRPAVGELWLVAMWRR